MPNTDPIQSLLATATPPELGPGPREGVDSLGALQARINDALSRERKSGDQADAIRALILLWHDHHDASHELVQHGATADASLVHGILHRREPDYGNARYWFHRVGRHDAFAEMARRAEPLLESSPELKGKLLARGQWDAFAFIDACEAAEGGRDTKAGKHLRELQRVEFESLLDHLCRG